MLTPIAAYLYYDRQKQMERRGTAVSGNVSSSVSLVFFILGALAFYLSWSCNTKQAVSTGSKVFYGLSAFLDNITYILNYYVFKRNTSLTCA